MYGEFDFQALIIIIAQKAHFKNMSLLSASAWSILLYGFIISFDWWTKLKLCGSFNFIIKFGYNARYHWLKERALSEYKALSWAKAVTPSAEL